MKPFKQIKVYRWKSDTEKETYIFNKDDSSSNKDNEIVMNDIIYEDDNSEDALNKIALSIQNIKKTALLPIYAWNKTKPLSFNINSIKWSGYNINPYKSNNRKSNEINEPITYDFNTNVLFEYSVINIVFSNDIPDLQNNKYYFIQKKIPAYDTYKKRDKKLLSLESVDISNIKLVSEIYHRIDLEYKLKKFKLLSDIFNNLHANNNIPMIQWVNDSSKILYKLYKKHNISSEQLSNWTNVDKISKIQSIFIYSVMTNGTYCKVTLDNNGNVLFSYIIDLRQSINWKDIISNKNKIIIHIEGAVKESIKLKELSLKLNVFFEIDNSSMDLLSKKIGEYIDIFHVIKISREKDKQRITCTYKRSSNYNKESIDISEYVKSRLKIGVSKLDIIIELVNLGINSDEASNIIDDEIEMIRRDNDMNDGEKPKINLSNTGTIIVIEPYREGYLINIINLPNRKELTFLLYWLQRIISTSRDTKKFTKQQPIKSYIPPPKKSSSSSKESEKIDDDDEEDLGLKDYDLSDGGALGKQKHSYFVNMLQLADKDLFTENYAREKCQASSQPVVMSKEYKKVLEDGNNLHFDNIIEYGSKPETKNFYACPRLWCPQSKIPLNVNDPSAKCPIENEEPMKLFWENDKNRERYVKLIKPNDKGLCVPCCFKKKPKEEELAKCNNYLKDTKKEEKNVIQNDVKKTSEVKEPEIDIIRDENYLMNQSAPIFVGRYGIIPAILHDLLFPDVSFVLCSKTLNKSQKCLVRKGITHRSSSSKLNTKDSLLHAIASSLNFKTKKDFIRDIKNKLDLITFISLENGEVCKSFIDINEIIPEYNKGLCNELKNWLEKNNITKKLFNIDELACDNYNLKLSRLLNIYKGYIKFINYLESNDYPNEKSPYYLYSLLSSLYEVLLIIWEKIEKTNEINIMCPYYSSFEDLLSGMDLNPNMIMLLKDKKYYEPLELKLRSTDGEKTIKLNEFPNMKKLVSECTKLKEHNDDSDVIYKKLYTLNQWTKTKILKNSNKFIIDRVLINNDLSIDRFLTKGNILIKLDKQISISLLPTFIKNLNIKHIIFYDDIVASKLSINILSNDLDIYIDKIKSLGDISIEVGELKKGIKEDAFELYTSLIIPIRNIKNTNIIHTNIKNIINEHTMSQNKQQKKWYQLQLMVASKLIEKYDDESLQKILPQDKTDTFFKLFKNIKDRDDIDKLQVIFEEIPIYSIQSIKNWVNNIIIYTKYDYFDKIIKEDNKEFIFSQLAIVNGIPNKLLKYHDYLPNNEINENKLLSEDYIIKAAKEQSQVLPSLYSGTPEKLKTKWIMHKKSKWINMVILKNLGYNMNTIPEFYDWFSKKIGISSSYDEIKKVTRAKYFEIMNNKEGMFMILEDPSYFNEWNNNIGKKFKTIQLFWDNFYTDLSDNEKRKIINKILDDDKLYPNDLNLISISELLNISILVIHRGKYGKYDDSLKRGEIDDLVLSSTLFVAKKNMLNRPILILNKTYDKYKSVYYSIIEKTDSITYNSIYLQYKDIPNNVKVLIHAHMK
jgi:hypothetical protein